MSSRAPMTAEEETRFHELLRDAAAECGQLSWKWLFVLVPAAIALDRILEALIAVVFGHRLHYEAAGLLGGAISSIGAWVIARRSRRAQEALSRFTDSRAAGPLARSLGTHDKRIRSAARAALVQLLPHLQASDTDLLDARDRVCLNRSLAISRFHRPDAELATAILTALEQVGDASALPVVQRLAAAGPGGGVSPSVVAKARECLPFLQARAEAAEPGRQLLRAAGVSPGVHTDLLTPARAAKSDPEVLLRTAGLPAGRDEGPES